MCFINKYIKLKRISWGFIVYDFFTHAKLGWAALKFYFGDGSFFIRKCGCLEFFFKRKKKISFLLSMENDGREKEFFFYEKLLEPIFLIYKCLCAVCALYASIGSRCAIFSVVLSYYPSFLVLIFNFFFLFSLSFEKKNIIYLLFC